MAHDPNRCTDCDMGGLCYGVPTRAKGQTADESHATFTDYWKSWSRRASAHTGFISPPVSLLRASRPSRYGAAGTARVGQMSCESLGNKPKRIVKFRAAVRRKQVCVWRCSLVRACVRACEDACCAPYCMPITATALPNTRTSIRQQPPAPGTAVGGP